MAVSSRSICDAGLIRFPVKVAARTRDRGRGGLGPLAAAAPAPHVAVKLPGPGLRQPDLHDCAVLVFEGGLVASLREYWASEQVGLLATIPAT